MHEDDIAGTSSWLVSIAGRGTCGQLHAHTANEAAEKYYARWGKDDSSFVLVAPPTTGARAQLYAVKLYRIVRVDKPTYVAEQITG
jgi:hypothetical protein